MNKQNGRDAFSIVYTEKISKQNEESYLRNIPGKALTPTGILFIVIAPLIIRRQSNIISKHFKLTLTV
ncbi:Hypothetical predicted protein [Octopus vulgaris]|uniref:Uncharacterized protein n=1 Tax=Octopus vulgaris TaxID=6645 RepID=A0AA36BLM4_OCTVU|nr:Hypothetical predicted protein [Octopus vulgaris]